MIPEVRFDFSFDIILLLLFFSYLLYGYFSGGHKQIRLSINLILPFMIIYYLGRQITSYLYLPLSNTLFFQFIFEQFDTFKYTISMIIAYIITYLLIFVVIFIFSIYARRHILNENMRAKLGRKNNYLGALVAFLNGYVLIYFIILPVFAMNLIDSDDHVTNFVLEHPPPFSRIARTAEKAVPVKDLADKADKFQQLLSVDGIEGYYNDAIYDYQQQYIGSSDSFESEFMTEVYPNLTSEAKTLIETEFNSKFGTNLSSNNFQGISLVLIEESVDGLMLYEAMINLENSFEENLALNQEVVDDYQAELTLYETNLSYYNHQLLVDAYEVELAQYILDLNSYIEAKIDAIVNETELPVNDVGPRPLLSVEAPEGYTNYDDPEPTPPIYSQDVIDSEIYVDTYGDKVDVTSELLALGSNFKNHEGLLVWYVEDLELNMASSSSGGDISDVINSFKVNYEDIVDGINDEELESKLYLAQMSIISYDVFNEWLTCTTEKIDTVELDDIELPEHRCPVVDLDAERDYDFANNALSLLSTLFDGESVSWIIVQFKYDYENGLFEDPFNDFPEVVEVLESTKELVDDYDELYKDVAASIDGNISMVLKIGISVVKSNMDVYDTLENTPLLSAFVNDLARMCSASNTTKSAFNRNVEYCVKSEGEGGVIADLFNMQYLSGEVLFKAYIMIDENNEPIIYDTDKMEEFLAKINESVKKNVFSREVISTWGDQFAFNILDETVDYTLLEQMYDDGQITIDAMRILANDEYDLFSSEFSQRVRSMIR